MLPLLALACEGDGRALVRVARFSEYQVPLADVRALRGLAREQEVPFPRALELAITAEKISPDGKATMALLVRFTRHSPCL